MAEDLRGLSDLESDPQKVHKWAGKLTRAEIHESLWPQANRRSHDITAGLRDTVKRIYPDPHDQEMVFDGIALAIEAKGKLEDDQVIENMLKNSSFNPAVLGKSADPSNEAA